MARPFNKRSLEHVSRDRIDRVATLLLVAVFAAAAVVTVGGSILIWVGAGKILKALGI